MVYSKCVDIYVMYGNKCQYPTFAAYYNVSLFTNEKLTFINFARYRYTLVRPFNLKHTTSI